MNCLFTNKEKAAKFVLPVWAADALEITGKARYSDYSLVRRGFPKLKELKIS
jgi:CYTH domain-containing protein